MKYTIFNYKTFSWKKYLFETLSIFIAVVSAFGLNNWNQNQRDKEAEIGILKEVSNGIKNDLFVIRYNKQGNVIAKKACAYMRDLIENKTVNQDSIRATYIVTFSDFLFTANTTGYKGLESKGLDI